MLAGHQEAHRRCLCVSQAFIPHLLLAAGRIVHTLVQMSHPLLSLLVLIFRLRLVLALLPMQVLVCMDSRPLLQLTSFAPPVPVRRLLSLKKASISTFWLGRRKSSVEFILIRFKPLAVEYNGSMLLIAIAQRTLMMLITPPQLPLPAAGSADGVRFKIIDGHMLNYSCLSWLNAIAKAILQPKLNRE
jgi:hypothetical protein